MLLSVKSITQAWCVRRYDCAKSYKEPVVNWLFPISNTLPVVVNDLSLITFFRVKYILLAEKNFMEKILLKIISPLNYMIGILFMNELSKISMGLNVVSGVIL